MSRLGKRLISICNKSMQKHHFINTPFHLKEFKKWKEQGKLKDEKIIAMLVNVDDIVLDLIKQGFSFAESIAIQLIKACKSKKELEKRINNLFLLQFYAIVDCDCGCQDLD
jgi:hypothetical protein